MNHTSFEELVDSKLASLRADLVNAYHQHLRAELCDDELEDEPEDGQRRRSALEQLSKVLRRGSHRHSHSRHSHSRQSQLQQSRSRKSSVKRASGAPHQLELPGMFAQQHAKRGSLLDIPRMSGHQDHHFHDIAATPEAGPQGSISGHVNPPTETPPDLPGLPLAFQDEPPPMLWSEERASLTSQGTTTSQPANAITAQAPPIVVGSTTAPSNPGNRPRRGVVGRFQKSEKNDVLSRLNRQATDSADAATFAGSRSGTVDSFAMEGASAFNNIIPGEEQEKIGTLFENHAEDEAGSGDEICESALTRVKSELYESEEKRTSGEAFVFSVLPVWKLQRRISFCRNFSTGFQANNSEGSSPSSFSAGYNNAEDSDSESDEEEDDEKLTRQIQEEEICLVRYLFRLMVPPTSRFKMIWDMIGVVTIIYEFVVLPMQFMDLPPSLFLGTAAWCVRLYWTLDFPYSFVKCFSLPDGRIQRNPRLVAWDYFTTWLGFDLLLLFLDWLETALGSDGLESLSAARMGKTVRFIRWFRMMRMVRLFRMKDRMVPDFFRAAAYMFHSETFMIILGIAKIIVFMIGCAHFIACCWYGLGIEEMEGHSDDQTSWLKKFDFEEVSIPHRYSVSLYWSLSQFHGSADVYPTNMKERTFAIVVLIFAFIVSVCVISSVTSSLTRLQIVTARTSTQVALLNQYLYDNQISSKVAMRVQRNVKYALLQEKKHTPEGSIELLALVSGPLRVELHYEINRPILSWHAFFDCYADSNAPAFRRLCHTGISHLSLCRGDVLFSSGEIPPNPSMFFCLQGKFQYEVNDGWSGADETIHANQCFCEAVLWCQWVHFGQMRAKTESSLLLLNAEMFQSIASQFQTREFYPKRYAEEYVSALSDCSMVEVNDLEIPNFSIEDACIRIFPAVYTSHLTDNLRRDSVTSRTSNIMKVTNLRKQATMSFFSKTKK